jgi:hypothetical protein
MGSGIVFLVETWSEKAQSKPQKTLAAKTKSGVVSGFA